MLIEISAENKKRLDAIARLLAVRRMVKGVSYNEVVTEILDSYDKAEAQANDEMQEQENGYNQSRGL